MQEPVGTSPDGRKIFKFWAWDNTFKLKLVDAWQNTAMTDTYWVPSLGWTGQYGICLFNSAQGAYDAAEAVLNRREEHVRADRENLIQSKMQHGYKS